MTGRKYLRCESELCGMLRLECVRDFWGEIPDSFKPLPYDDECHERWLNMMDRMHDLDLVSDA